MQFFISFIAGVVLFYSFRYFPFFTAFISLLSSASLLRKKLFFLILALIAGAAFAFLRYESVKDVPHNKNEVVVSGVFESYPLTTANGTFKQTLTAKSAVDTETGESLCELSGRDIVLLSDRGFAPGTECELAVKLLKSRQRLNPGEQAIEGVYATLAEIYREDHNRMSLYSKIQGYRYSINKFVKENIGEDSGAFVSSITTGEAADMSEELKEAFKVTGLAHILSISGSHFGLFSVLLFGVFRFLMRALPYRFLQRMTIYLTPSQAAALFCLPFMLGYLGLSGANIPAVRSFIMISLFLCGLIIGKKGFWLSSILFAAFIIVIWQPDSVFNISFQLSFLAVFFIGCVIRESHEDGEGSGKLVRYVRNALLMTLAASIGTAPLVAYYFHYFSVISPLSNLIAAPIIGFLLVPLSIVSCFLFLATGHFIFTPMVSLLSNISIALVNLFSRFPYASISIPAFPPILLIVFYTGVIASLLLNRMRSSRKRNPASSNAGGDPSLENRPNGKDEPSRLGSVEGDLRDVGKTSGRVLLYGKSYLPALFFIPIAIYFVLLIPGKKGLSVTFLDVGQGDSAVAELPDGKVMIVDTGRTGRETASFLTYRGKKNVDILALSHVHPDHTGGWDSIVRKFHIREIWDNGRIVFPDNSKNLSLSRGDLIEGKGYKIYALHPYPGFYTMMEGSECSSANNDSLVLKIEAGNFSLLFPGDIEEEAEKDILHLGGRLKSTVIKIPHHGGKTSAYGPFINAVSADVAVISAGRDNSFGHPHQETLDALHGISVFRTDISGAVKITRSGGETKIKTYGDFCLTKAKCLSDEMKNFRLLTETW